MLDCDWSSDVCSSDLVVTAAGVSGEVDRGTGEGLGAVGPMGVSPLGPVVLGNQLLPAASVGSFGALSAPVRDLVQFQPPSGAYALPRDGGRFRVALRGPGPDHVVRARWTGSEVWTELGPDQVVELSANARVQAFALHRVTGVATPMATARYSFDAMPALAPATPADGDGNGLNDGWQLLFGVADARSDADGDGANALEEQRAGTDPNDPASHPGVVEPTAPALVFEGIRDGRIQLRWPAEASGWALEVSADLAAWSTDNPPAAGNSWSEPVAGAYRFFRLRRP
jgi:hypothetical protein